MATVSSRSEENLRSVKPELGNVVRDALKAAPSWLDFAVISGKRTDEEQRELFLKGRDQAGNIVDRSAVVTFKDGSSRRSRHQDGDAVDIVAYVDGDVSWDEQEIAIRAAYIAGYAAGEAVRLTGGIRWKWDQGHLELIR